MKTNYRVVNFKRFFVETTFFKSTTCNFAVIFVLLNIWCYLFRLKNIFLFDKPAVLQKVYAKPKIYANF